MPKILLPAEIMALIASFLPADIFVIKLYSVFPEYRNSPCLPRLENNYNYFIGDYSLTKRLLKYGYKLNVNTNYKSLPLLANNEYRHNVISLNIYISHYTVIMRNNIYAFKYLEELVLPLTYIDLNIKRVSKYLKVYKYSSILSNPDTKKYEKLGIKCVNLAMKA